MTAFARAVAALHRDPNLSVACTYTPPEGTTWPDHAPVSLRAIEAQPIEGGFGMGGPGAIAGRRLVDVQVADLPGPPERGAGFTIGAEAFRVDGPPERDVEGLTWRLTLVRAA